MNTENGKAIITIPPVSMIAERLSRLNQKELRDLARDSGVSFGVITKIRYGITPNPGIETVRKFFHLLPR